MKFFKKQKKIEESSYEIANPFCGEVIDIDEVNDKVFSSKAMGDGVGIKSQNGVIVSPVSGTITVAFPTKHAYGITSNEGIEILVHIGIDTVELGGEGFRCYVQQGQTILRGEKLCEVDHTVLHELGYDSTVMIIITNTAEFSNIDKYLGQHDVNEVIMKLEK